MRTRCSQAVSHIRVARDFARQRFPFLCRINIKEACAQIAHLLAEEDYSAAAFSAARRLYRAASAVAKSAGSDVGLFRPRGRAVL